MNIDLFAGRPGGGLRMRTDIHALGADSISILRRFDWRALVAAMVSLPIFLFLLDIHPLISLFLAVAVYSGVALLLGYPAPAIELEPPTPEEAAFARMRVSTAHVLELAAGIQKPEIEDRVTLIGHAFAKMLDVMQEDAEYSFAPEYETEVVGPFEQKLGLYRRLTDRGIDTAAPLVKRFEEQDLRGYETLTRSFYQQYHVGDVINLAALLELFRAAEVDKDEPDEPEDELEDFGDEDGEEGSL